MPNKKIVDKTFLNIAAELANLSNCVSFKIGCVLVKEGRVVTMGYNGTPEGFLNCSEKFDENNFDREEHHEWSKKFEVHAEMNALLFAANQGISITNTTLYSTVQPSKIGK